MPPEGANPGSPTGAITGRQRPRRGRLPAGQYVEGILSGDRVLLARAITVIESELPDDGDLAERILEGILPHAGGSRRVGITGVPGAGKSTFIETLGLFLVEHAKRVAVLAVDPTSSISGGSILADRTRMPRLGAHPAAFIRPSPSGGTLGGVTKRTRESIVICEAAGFDTILIETVGVGQSETGVVDLCDCLLALAVAGTGDELQGIKRGLLEVVDVLAVNKADAANTTAASLAARELSTALHLARGSAPCPNVLTCSARTGAGVPEVWSAIESFVHAQRASGDFENRRRRQDAQWLCALVQQELSTLIARYPSAQAALTEAEARVTQGLSTPPESVSHVLESLFQAIRSEKT